MVVETCNIMILRSITRQSVIYYLIAKYFSASSKRLPLLHNFIIYYAIHVYFLNIKYSVTVMAAILAVSLSNVAVPVEDTSLREMAEYFSEVNHEDLLDKLPGGNRPFTVILYKNGDQLNVFRVVDREVASPTSESLRYI